ncbi:MAG: hypothetical protein OJF59_002526 [Cytophagales bacterium]|jgi:hypothetical protein|nr:hypothetical protein [Bacteroidota bacterium]MBS1980248.1 hypothetical protein [Bacteroidota bacterium]WHZ08772.1 MAG: hypothetical protein OJF59_002526 [Cytophagales bacterium]
MAFATYTTKYFCNIYDWSGSHFLVNLNLSGGTSGATEIVHYDFQPLTLEWQGGRSQSDLAVFGSNAIFKFYQPSGTTYDFFLSSPYKTWQLEVSGNTGLYWIGWVRPDNSQKSRFIMPQAYISLGANDGLNDLKNIAYTASTKYTGYTSVIATVQECVNKTGLNIGLRAQNNTKVAQMTGTTDILSAVYHRSEHFYQKNSTGYTYTSCYDVISQLLEPFNCQLSQTGNYKGWTITNKNEISSSMFYYPINLVSGTVSSSSYSRSVTGSSFIADSDQLSYVLPVKSFATTFMTQLSTGKTAGNLIQYPNFASTKGWNNGTGTTAFYSYNIVGGYADLDEPNGFGNPNTTKMIYTKVYGMSDGQAGSTFNVSCQVKLNKCTFSSGSALPALKIIVYKPDGTKFTDTAKNFTSVGSYATFSNQNSISLANVSGTYTIEFQFVPNAGATYSEIEYYFTNAFAWASYTIASKTLESDYDCTGSFNSPQSDQAQANTIMFSDGGKYFQYGPYPSMGGLICYNNVGLPTSGWTGYPYPTLAFANYDFTGSTSSPWQQMAKGGNVSWTYDNINHNFNINSSLISGYTFFQPTLFNPGAYALKIQATNSSTVVGGSFQNVSLNILSLTANTSGYSAQFLNNATLYSDGTLRTYFIGFNIVQPSYIGFSANGTNSNLNVKVSSIVVNSFVAYDYNQPHYEFYLWSKMKKLQNFHRYVNLGIRQSNIFYNSIVYLPLRGFNYPYVPFFITDYTYDVLGNVVQLQLEELTRGFQYAGFSSIQLPTANGN